MRPRTKCRTRGEKWTRSFSYWQEFGIGGFRADMAHMVPMEFWRWAIARARARGTEGKAFFLAEAYDGDPAKLWHGNVLEALLESGFDSVYDGESSELMQQIYEGPKWANDLDELAWRGPLFQNALRYAENHDEVRIASPYRWGGHGMKVGPGSVGHSLRKCARSPDGLQRSGSR